MPQPIPLPVRQHSWERFQQGQDAPTIAAALHLPRRTVPYLLRRYRLRGRTGVQPDYQAPPRPAPVGPGLREEALGLRQAHPTWGAGFIRVRLQDRHPGVTLPSERTLQRWFRRAAPASAPPGRKPVRERQSARAPHAVWQIDAAERIPLQTGERVCWLRGVDEYTGAVLGTQVFPPGPLVSGSGHGNPSGFPPVFRPLGAAGGRARR